MRDEQRAAEVVPTKRRAAEVVPTSRQLDLASKVQQAVNPYHQGGQVMQPALLTSRMRGKECSYAINELAEVSSK